ncbi:MAG: SRPBCC family protein [Acidimicrobiales bacterium]|jgi:uncharacterized protein YndB with AHSA1/START domain
MTSATATVRLERVIRAPRHQLYRAWLEPDLLRRWLAPGELQVTRVEVEERVGGHFRVWQGTGAGEVGGFECEILELVPDQRIVMRWGFVGPDRAQGPLFDSVLTVTFGETDERTTALTLTHERLEDLHAAMPEVAEKVETGWERALDKLTSATLDREHPE